MKEQLPLPPKPPRKRVLDDGEEVPLVQNVEEVDEEEEDDDNDDVWELRHDDRHIFLDDDELEPGSIG